ncbi:MAG: glycosyltransferase family 2 protein [Flavobacteriaceae bacterium]
MKLSILIPLYNKEKYIERCLDSIFNQDLSREDYEVIIVDDGSKDNGVNVVEHYIEKNPTANISLFLQKNQGPSAARNNSLTKAQGEYVYFLDADDLIVPNTLKPLLTLCREHGLDIVEFDTNDVNDDQVAQLSELMRPGTIQLAKPILDGQAYFAAHDFRNQAWRFFIKRSFLLDTGILFLEYMRAYEDMIFTASTFLRAHSIGKVDYAVHNYVKVAGSIVTSKDPAINLGFIQGMVKAVEELDILIKGLNGANENYPIVVKRLKAKQQTVVFALIVRAFKYRLHNWKELRTILDKMNTLGAYPIDAKLGVGNGKGGLNAVFIPIFNTKMLLFLALKIMRTFRR